MKRKASWAKLSLGKDMLNKRLTKKTFWDKILDVELKRDDFDINFKRKRYRIVKLEKEPWKLNNEKRDRKSTNEN